MSGEEQGEYVFTWKIKNYSSSYQAEGEFIESPSFTVETLPGCQWNLSLEDFKGEDVSCFLNWKSLSENVQTTTIFFGLEIVDENGGTLSRLEVEDQGSLQFSSECSSWGTSIDNDILDKDMSTWVEDTLTFRCRIKTAEQCKLTIVGSVACTTIGVERFCVDWYVKIFSLLKYSESVSFPISSSYNLKITLSSVSEALDIFIHFQEEQSEVPQQLTITFSIFDKIGCKLRSKRAVHSFKNEETWTFPDFLTKELLKNCEVNTSQYEFKLMCEVCISKKCISSEKTEFLSPFSSTSMPIPKPELNMQNQFRNLLISKNYSDVTIRGKNVEFPAHKFILRVRSPVFAAMFDQDMLENKTGVVDIADLDGNTLKAFLEYLYTETVHDMEYDVATKLMLTADKYQVPLLVDECASFLKSIVSVENVCEIIYIADLIHCENLKSYALNFIKVHAAEILPTTSWAAWIEGNIKLATHILSKLSVAIGTENK